MSSTPIVFLGAKGGVGTTLCACTAALSLAEKHPGVFIDAAGGDAALMLGQPPNSTGQVNPTLYLARCTTTAEITRTISAHRRHRIVIDGGRWQAERADLGTCVLVVRNDYLSVAHALHVEADQVIAICSPAGHQLTHQFDCQLIDLTA